MKSEKTNNLELASIGILIDVVNEESGDEAIEEEAEDFLKFGSKKSKKKKKSKKRKRQNKKRKERLRKKK